MKNKPFIIGGIIACVLIIGGIIGFILAKGNSGNESLDGIEPVAFEEVSEDDAISEKEYMALLNEAFNYEDSIEYSDNKITGKAAVAKGVDRLGPAYREYLLDGTEDTSETRFDLVEKKGVLSKEFEDAYLSSTQAEALIKNFTALATIEDYHVSVSKYEAAEGVVDGSDWTATYYTSHEDGTEEALIEIKGDAPSVGEKLIYKDTVGVLRGGTISAIEKRDGDIYDVLTTKPASLDDLLTDYTVAGYVDWSQVAALNTEDGTQVLDTSGVPNYSFVSTNKDKGVKTTVTVTGTVSISNASSDDAEAGLEVTGFKIGDKDYSYLCDAFNSAKESYENISELADDADDEETDDEDAGDEDTGEEDSSKVDIEISLEDFQLYAYANKEGGFYYECLYKPVLKMGDAKINYSFDLPAIPIPLGIAKIDLALGLHADMEMENIDVVITTENPTGSILVFDENGYSNTEEKAKIVSYFENGSTNEEAATVTLTSGVTLKASLTILEVSVIDPKIDFYAKLSAEQLEIVPGFENACWEANVVGPMIDFYITDDESESLASYIADSLIKLNIIEGTKIPLLTEANTFSLYYHLEFDDSPMIKEDPNHDASVCTHVAADGSRSKIRRHVDYTLPKSIDEIDIDKKTAKLYQDFLDGKVTASVVKDNNYPDAFEDVNKEYSFDDLYNDTLKDHSKKCEDWDFEKDYYDYSITNNRIEYIDAGKDDNPEMIITFSRKSLNYDSSGDWARVILRNNDGKPEICYRYVISLYSGDGSDTGADIYYNGMIYDTYSGVNYGGYSCGYIDSDGVYCDWYKYSTITVTNGMYTSTGEYKPIFDDDNTWGIVGIHIPPYDDDNEADSAYSYICPNIGTWEEPDKNQISIGDDPALIFETNSDYKANFDAFAKGMANFRELQKDNDGYSFYKEYGYFNEVLSIAKSKELVEEQRQKIGLTDDIYYVD